MLGKVGTVWSRQVDASTREKATAITEVSGCADILRHTDTLAQYAVKGGRILVDDLSFRFVDGNFAVIGKIQSDYVHVTTTSVDGSSLSLALSDDNADVSSTPVPTDVARLSDEFVSAIVGAESHLPAGSDWYLVPMPTCVTPIVIEGLNGTMLVSGVDFSAHAGYIATRLSPAKVFPPGVVRIVAAYLDLPQPNSFLLSAPVGRRCSKFLMEYARKTQSLRAFKRAAAEYCGMFVFPEPDLILGKHAVPGATVYVTAAMGALRIDYTHIPLVVGVAVDAGHVVAPRFEVWSTNANASMSIFDRALASEALVSLDGVLPVKGLFAPPDNKVLIDYVEVDPVSNKPHARLHLAGDTVTLQKLWDIQRNHELATGNFLYDQFFDGGQTAKLLPLGEIMEDYYGSQLVMVVTSGMDTPVIDLLHRFVAEHKPAGCVMLTATA